MNSRFRILLIDIGNVIIDASHAITHKVLIKGYPKEMAEKFYTDFYLDFNRGKLTPEEFATALATNYYGGRVYGTFTVKLMQSLHDLHIFGLVKGAPELLEKLRRYKENIVFLTNTNIWQTEREKQLIDLQPYCRCILRSHEKLGKLKTDEGAFEDVLRMLNVEAKDVLFVDDSQANINAAKKLGIETILFENVEQTTQALVSYGYEV